MKLTSDNRPDAENVSDDKKALKTPYDQFEKGVVKAPPKADAVSSMIVTSRPDEGKIIAAHQALRERPTGPIKAWAFSTLKQFETCKYAAFLSKVKKAPRVQSPAADRGQQMHDIAEAYIRGEGDELDFPKLIQKMAYDYRQVRLRFERNPERFELEQNWGFTEDWHQTDFFGDDVWCRQKLDLIERDSETSCFILDHKSGKKFGNELKHADQGLQYALGAFLRYPMLQFANVNFWYTDHKQKLERSYTREQVMALKPRIEERALRMTKATEEELMVPSPTINNCRFCDHAKTGTCEYATRPPDPEYA